MTDPLQTSSKLSRNIPFLNFFLFKSLIIKISKASQMKKNLCQQRQGQRI